MQPRSDGLQRCLRFGLSTSPASRVRMYQDPEGNIVHHFNIPGRHSRLSVTAEAFVECATGPTLPRALEGNAWERIAAGFGSDEFWEVLNPSPFTQSTPRLNAFASEIGLDRHREEDPLVLVRRIALAIYEGFEYRPEVTRVDSPIDDALGSRSGVCQDFAHIMIALVRPLGIPCRYVSGYLFCQGDSAMRSSDGATHAWVETWLPDLGWIGFDPTNNVEAGESHIRVAIGRDYSDVPPTRGVFKGSSAVNSELAVAVRIGPVRTASADEATAFIPWMSHEAPAPLSDVSQQKQQQQ